MRTRTIVLSSGVIIGAALLPLVGQQRLARLVDREVAALRARDVASVGPEQLRARWDTLPDPVRRYLHYVIPPATPAIRTVHLRHVGTFRTAPDQAWLAIEGEEDFTAAAPEFVWRARVWAMPFVWIDARDRLLAGRGNMLVRVASTFTIANASGSEIDQGAAMRWLAENIWFPYGFVGDRMEWSPIDGRSARVTMQHEGVPVSIVVEVDDEGKLVTIQGTRYRDLGDGRSALTPWFARCSDYRMFEGVRVPAAVEVGWLLDGGEFSYARFRVTALEYNAPGE